MRYIEKLVEDILKEKGVGIRQLESDEDASDFINFCGHRMADYLNAHHDDMPVPGELIAALTWAVAEIAMERTENIGRGIRFLSENDKQLHEDFLADYFSMIRGALILGMASVEYREGIQTLLNSLLKIYEGDDL
jgi:hypothetical protein